MSERRDPFLLMCNWTCRSRSATGVFKRYESVRQLLLSLLLITRQNYTVQWETEDIAFGFCVAIKWHFEFNQSIIIWNVKNSTSQSPTMWTIDFYIVCRTICQIVTIDSRLRDNGIWRAPLPLTQMSTEHTMLFDTRMLFFFSLNRIRLLGISTYSQTINNKS